MPFAAGLLVAAPLILAALVIYGMNAGNQNWMQSVYDAWERRHLQMPPTLVKTLKSFVPFGIRRAVGEARASLSRYTVASMGALVVWLNGADNLLKGIFLGHYSFAAAVAGAIERIRTVELPFEVQRGVAPVRRSAREALRRATRALARARAARLAAAAATGIAIGVGRRSRAADRRIERALERFRNRFRTVERTLRRHAGSLRALRRWASYAAIAGVVMRVLARRLPWLFCRRVKRWNTNMCRVNDDWITAWLEGSLILWGGLSIEEFVRDAQGLAGFTVAQIENLIREA